MTALYYRLTATTDPEERLEDAALWKAMHDHYGAGITLLAEGAPAPVSGLLFGRTRHFESQATLAARSWCPYWGDPAFRAGISREFHITDLEGADDLVQKIHATGKDVFIKAAEQKLLTAKLPVGTELLTLLGDMAYSFMDKPNSLMVQEAVEMRNERRFVVMDRKIVTHSAVAYHLTPVSRGELHETGFPPERIHFSTPTAKTWSLQDDLLDDMTDLVERTMAVMRVPHMIIDVASVNGRAELIEFNPCQPGHFGLYACDPKRIAAASEAMLTPDLLTEVRRRREENDPAPAGTLNNGKEILGILGDADEPYADEEEGPSP